MNDKMHFFEMLTNSTSNIKHPTLQKTLNYVILNSLNKQYKFSTKQREISLFNLEWWMINERVYFFEML